MDCFDERGRDKCLQDMRYDLEHRAPAVELEDPGLFAAYARWLDVLLAARVLATAKVARSLEPKRRITAERVPPEESTVVARCIQAGLAALRPGPA